MDTHHHHEHGSSLNKTAFSATLHCLSGCATGEVLGLIIGTAASLSAGHTIALAVALAFFFGYLFTMLPLLRHGMSLGAALGLAFASDTASIAIMEVVDNTVMYFIPGAMNAGLSNPIFWISMVIALIIAGVFAYPVNRWLITRGKGHALVHMHHTHH